MNRRVLLEIAVYGHALDFRGPGLAVEVVDLTTRTVVAAVDYWEEADGVAEAESCFCWDGGAEGDDCPAGFVALPCRGVLVQGSGQTSENGDRVGMVPL